MAFAATMIIASSCNKEPIEEPVQDNNFYLTATILSGGHMSSGKSNQYLIALSDDGYVHNYMLSLVGQLGEIDENGYVTIPFGTYTQSGGTGDYTIAGYAAYLDKSEDAENSKTVELTESTVVVTENQIVLTTVVEGVTHIVTYNGAPSLPADLPEPDVDFEANYVYAYYTDNTIDENTALFKLFFSDLGRDEDGNAIPNGIYYELVVVVNRLAPNAEIAIPAGRYEIDDTESTNGYIVDAQYHKFGDSLSERAKYDFAQAGHLTVNEDGSIEASLDMYFSGATHNLSFSGDVEILENTIPDEAPYSTLTSNKECDLSNHTIEIWSHGDRYESDYLSWGVSITSNNPVGDSISFEILRGTDSDTDFSGRYTVSNSMEEFTVVPGYVNGFTLTASWYYYRENSLHISAFAPIVDGWVEIQVTDDNVYNVTFDVYDDLNNNITGTFTQVIPTNVSNVSGVSYPAITL